MLLCAASAASLLHGDDGVTLDVTLGLNPGEVRLDWTGGTPGFRVYRSTVAPHMVAPSNELGVTQDQIWLDTPPAGDLFYYRVIGPCLTPSAESCDGVDDDCNAIVDDGCGPCQSDSDCDAFDGPSACQDPASCQGTRPEGVCNASQQCVVGAVADDSGCAGQSSSDCGPYPGIACTSASHQPVNQASLCPSSCVDDAQCDVAGHCDETGGACLDDFPAGFGCVAPDDCVADFCVDGVCCGNACAGTCAACDLGGSMGSCFPVPDGQDPDAECGAVSCLGYYWGFSSDTCHRKADVTVPQASCGGDGACRTSSEECSTQIAQGPGTITCHGLCQNPTPGTCSGTTPGSCTNVNPGTQSCGIGACLRSAPQCTNGSPATCTPGTPVTETCNDLDDNCDGTVDNGSFADSQEPNGSCASFRTLTTVGSDQTLGLNTVTVYPSGDTDYFRINATETDASCACCDFFCTDEDYLLKVTLNVPPGAGSYDFCTSVDCGTVGNNCVTVSPGTPQTWTWSLDGACGAGIDSYSVYVRISPGSSPGFECAPYTLTYFFDALVCN